MISQVQKRKRHHFENGNFGQWSHEKVEFWSIFTEKTARIFWSAKESESHFTQHYYSIQKTSVNCPCPFILSFILNFFLPA
jgi:hypothetical protein